MKAWYYFTRQHCAWCCKGPASNKGLCLICLKYYYIHKSKFTDVFTSFKQNSHLWDCSCVYLSPIFDTLDTFVRDFNWALAVNPRVYRTGKGGSCPMWLQIFPKYGCRGTMQMFKYMHTCSNAWVHGEWWGLPQHLVGLQNPLLMRCSYILRPVFLTRDVCILGFFPLNVTPE